MSATDLHCSPTISSDDPQIKDAVEQIERMRRLFEEYNEQRSVISQEPSPASTIKTLDPHYRVHFEKGCDECPIDYAILIPEKLYFDQIRNSPSLHLLALCLFLRREFPGMAIPLPLQMSNHIDTINLSYDDVYQSFRFLCHRCSHTSELLRHNPSQWISDRYQIYYPLYSAAADVIRQEQYMQTQKKYYIVQNISKDNFRPEWFPHFFDFYTKPKPPRGNFKYKELYAFVLSKKKSESPDVIEEYFRTWKEIHTDLTIHIIFITNCEKFESFVMRNHLIYLTFKIIYCPSFTKEKLNQVKHLIDSNCGSIIQKFKKNQICNLDGLIV